MNRSRSIIGAGLLAFLLLPLISVCGDPAPTLAGKRVLWLGDSITQAGGYVTFVQYYLNKKYPAEKFDFVSVGLSSETASGLSERTHPFPRPCVFERLQRALGAVKPQVVVACYGMNDGIYHPQSEERMQAFQDGIHKLISACHATGAQVILLTPPPFDRTAAKNLRPSNAPDFSYAASYENYDSVLADFAAWELTLPAKEALVIDLHGPIDTYLAGRRQTAPKFGFTKDGIHPDDAGHLLMAEIVLGGLENPIKFKGDLDAELAQAEKDPLYDLVKKQRENRSKGWLAYIGYTREKTVKIDSVEATETANERLQGKVDALRTH